MKKIIISLMFVMAASLNAVAMSFERAQAEALYLTDKMAYELNLNDQQYNDAYEINLDYLLRIDSPSNLYGDYYNYRLSDFRCILHDWQYSLLLAADYFLRPVVWRAGNWFFPIYSYYNRGYFYYSRPVVWRTYNGGHSRYYHRDGFYGNRRPMWDGGLRGRDMHRPVHHEAGRGGRGHRHEGNGYHIDLSGRHADGRTHHGGMNPGGNDNHYGNGRTGGMNPGGGGHRGNSFDGSSSRMNGTSRSASPSRSFSRDMGMSRSAGSYGGGSRGMGVSRSAGSYGGGSRGMGVSRSAGSYGGGSRGVGVSRSASSYGGGSRGVGVSRSASSHGGGSRGGRR